MADPKGFLTTPRETPIRRRSTSGSRTGARFTPIRAGPAAESGRPVHGLRHPVLPQGLPARQPDPGVERPGLARATGPTRSSGCTRRTTSRSSPGGCAPRPARPRACSASTRPGHDQAGRGRRSSTGPGTRAGSRPQAPERLPARRSPSSAPARPGWPRRSSSPGPGTPSSFTSGPTGSAGLLRYGIPEFKMEKRHLDRRLSRCGRGHPVPCRRRRRPRPHRRRSCATATTRSCWPAARPCRGTCRSPAATLGGIHQAMEYLPPSNRVVSRRPRQGADHRRPARTS